MGSGQSLNAGSSVSGSSLPGHASGDSSGSTASGSFGSYLQIWQWLVLLALLLFCIGAICFAVAADLKRRKPKRSKRRRRHVAEESGPLFEQVEQVAAPPVMPEVAYVASSIQPTYTINVPFAYAPASQYTV